VICEETTAHLFRFRERLVYARKFRILAKPHSLQTGRFCITLVADQGAERGKPSWRQPQRISPGELFRRGGKEAP